MIRVLACQFSMSESSVTRFAAEQTGRFLAGEGPELPPTLAPVSDDAQLPKLLLTGPPKSGKSTAVAHLVRLLEQHDIAVGGFVTHEQRERGRRVGFVVEDIAGPSAVFAHQSFSGVQVGRFGVDVAAFERVALPALRRAIDDGGAIVVDEIGRMELASEAFVRLVQEALDASVSMVATVHMHVHPFTDAVKRRSNVELLTLTEGNRDELPRYLLSRLTTP